MKKVVVIGSGIAGLIAAVEASHKHDVILVTKANLAESNTHYAQGGIAAVVASDDSIASHIQDTIAAGAGLCWEPAVNVLCSQGPDAINELVQLGVNFDRVNHDFARGLEAAHSHARVLHVGGDATGAGISDALVMAVKKQVREIREHTFLVDLKVKQNQITGVQLLDVNGISEIEADVVILASGGAGQMYRHTTNPSVTTGDGVAAALRAGAVLADIEFYQFHPTALAVPGSFLVSEAVRGEGAVLRNAQGERFMKQVHPLAELAPRDIVARGIQAEMLKQNGQPVLLDATALGADFMNARFPSITKACRSYGLDIARHPVPVTPAAHYWMGGVATDTFGRSSISGLFAVGEVAATGSHGANRLASNSLLESLVFSKRAVGAIDEQWPELPPQVRWQDQPPLQEIAIEIPSSAVTSNTQVVDRVELQSLMWDNVGLARSEDLLQSASDALQRWRPAAIENRLFTDWEDANLLTLATAVTASARVRHESRGSHYRLDFPTTHLEMARPITVVRGVSDAH